MKYEENRCVRARVFIYVNTIWYSHLMWEKESIDIKNLMKAEMYLYTIFPGEVFYVNKCQLYKQFRVQSRGGVVAVFFFNLMCFVLFCLRPLSSLPNVASVSEW